MWMCVVLCLVAQSCLTLCNPMDYTPPGSSVHGNSPSKNTGVGCHALLQKIFPTKGSNPGLSHFRQILYQLSHQVSIYIYIYIYVIFLMHSFVNRYLDCSISWFLWIMLQVMWECKYLFKILISIPLNTHPKVGLLDNIVILFLIEISPNKICRLPTGTWKDAQHH